MELILKKLGTPGRYHVLIAFLFAITWWSVTLGTVAMAFYGVTPNMTCNVPQFTSLNSTYTSNNVVEPLTNAISPDNHTTYPESVDGDPSWGVTVSEDQCSYTLHNESWTSTSKCNSWTYSDEGRGTITLVTEYNLVCGDTYKTSMTLTLFFVGVFFGALLFGFLADHFGRKKTLAFCLYTQMPISLAIAFMPDFISFTILRFLLGVWLQGISTVAFINCIEFFRQKYRGLVMVGFGISWAVGQLWSAFFAYILPNWRHQQIAASLICLLTAPYFWWLPDSPRWLFVKGRFDEIIDVFIHRAAKVNGLNVNATKEWCRERLVEIGNQQAQKASTEKHQSFVNILRTPILLKRLIAMMYMMFVSSMVYYVFILNTKNLAGNRYLNFAVGAALEIFINIAIIVVMTKFGRKRPLIISCVLVAVFCIICGVIPKQVNGVDTKVAVTVLASLGKMAIAAVMCLVFVYAAELFPTFARGSCMAFCGCSMRVGGMLAPQILFLKTIIFTEFPYIVIASAIIVGAVITFFLPETFGKAMPNTIEQAITMLPESRTDEQEEGDSNESELLTNSTKMLSDSESSNTSANNEKLTINA